MTGDNETVVREPVPVTRWQLKATPHRPSVWVERGASVCALVNGCALWLTVEDVVGGEVVGHFVYDVVNKTGAPLARVPVDSVALDSTTVEAMMVEGEG